MAVKRAVKRRTAKAKAPKIKITDETFRLNLAPLWGNGDYGFMLRGGTSSGDGAYGRLVVGCHTFESRKAAERHWPGNVSIQSGAHRRGADKLIAWAADEFKRRGYKW